MLNNWSAPEIWKTSYSHNNSKYNRKTTFFGKPEVDMYSFGAIFWEMETG